MIFKKPKRNEEPRNESIYFDNNDLLNALSNCVSLIVCTIEKNGHPIKRITLSDGRCFDERKHGEWYAYDRYSQWVMHYKCSECNAVADDSYKYCPYCGAKMEVEEDE